MNKLNLGAGARPIEGYRNIDAKNNQGTAEQTIFPLPDKDGTVDEIRASHVLEHFPYGHVGAIVKDWVRALKPGGVLKIAVPDMEYIAGKFLAGESINAQGYIMGGQTDALDFHKSIFHRALLQQVMEACGLVCIRDWKSEIDDCASLPVSLNLAGTKPGGAKLNISAVASMPRLGFNDFWGVMYDKCAKRGIPFRRSSGVYWGIKLTQSFEKAIELDKPDWLLALDYDTVFTDHQLDSLLDVAARHPEADAIAPIQASRHHSMPMLTIASDKPGMNRGALKREELDGELIQTRTAHFGCTLIRVEKLLALPKPWFNEVPDDKGGWGAGSIHEDIWFWKEWEKAGFKLFTACRVAVGHCDLAIRWPDGDLGTIWQTPRDFINTGAPEDVWR